MGRALVLAFCSRYELDVGEIDLSGLCGYRGHGRGHASAGVGPAARTPSSGRSRRGTPGDRVGFLVGPVVFVLVLMAGQPPVPRSTPLVAIRSPRSCWSGPGRLRAWSDRRDLADPRRTRRAIVIGSGDDAEYIVRSMLRTWTGGSCRSQPRRGQHASTEDGIATVKPDEDSGGQQRHAADLADHRDVRSGPRRRR
ncbi:hypothetical protein HBB16_11420 [Pseudonocardia sp. MCCB 268]|nr:hypothetical protein [Pseudonocardia cytotoxica]